MTQPPSRAAALYRTELAQTPLPEILVTIDRYKVPGMLECRRGAEEKRIYVDRGVIVFAGSNEPPVEKSRAQMEALIWSVFAWDEGSVAFTPGREKHLGLTSLDLPIARAVLAGVRRMPDARTLVARLGSKTTLLERTGAPRELALAADEEALLARVDGRTPLGQLVNTPPLAASDNARILYGLFALQLIAVRQHVRVQIKTRGRNEAR